MKYLGYLWANLRRNPVRTALTVTAIAIALFLFCFLEATLSALKTGVDSSNDRRLITRNRVSLVQPLPIAFRPKVQSVPGVAPDGTAYGIWFGAEYEADKDYFFAQYAVNEDTYFDIYPEILVPPDQMAAYAADRKGCIIGKKVAERLGKDVGDSIAMKGTIYPGTWEFNIRGIFEPSERGVPEEVMYLHYDYVDESRPESNQGLVGYYAVQLEEGADPARVADSIDALFENDAYQTKTETERAFRMSFFSMWGNVTLLLRFIGAAVIFTILLVAANTMMMSVRERTAEIGTLKTLGFQNRTIILLMLVEALLIGLIGGAVGCGLAVLALQDLTLPTGLTIPPVPAISVAIAFGLAALTGLVSGLGPSVLASRLSVVAAHRRI
ncbi:MAG: FtsX-like permease family protein [Planctomycetota bacterium]